MERWESLAPAELMLARLTPSLFDQLNPLTFGIAEGDEARHVDNSAGLNKNKAVFICNFPGLLKSSVGFVHG